MGRGGFIFTFGMVRVLSLLLAAPPPGDDCVAVDAGAEHYVVPVGASPDPDFVRHRFTLWHVDHLRRSAGVLFFF